MNQSFYHNSFQFLRLLLAFCVVISHSFALYYGNQYEPRLPLNGYYITLGNFAVYAFFVISGFVITQSLLNNPNPKVFLSNRIKRIFPGLVTCLFLTFIIFGPILDTSPLHYFQLETFNAAKYFVLNSTGFDIIDNIGGTLDNLKIEHKEINPVLWTIKYEIIAYILIALLGAWGLLQKYTILTLFLIFNFLYYLTLAHPKLHQLFNSYFMFSEAFMFLSYFLAGSLIYFCKDKILVTIQPVFNQAIYKTEQFSYIHKLQLFNNKMLIPKNLFQIAFFVLSTVVLFTAIQIDYLTMFGPICIAIITLNLGYILPFQKFPKYIPDISYGVYLYGWLVQLVIIKYFKDYISYQQYIALVIITTTTVGFLSNYNVERRFLKNKSRL